VIQHARIIFMQWMIAVYCFVVFSFELKNSADLLLNDILTSKRSHTIYDSYYLHHFHPLEVVKTLSKSYVADSSWVTIRDAEPHDLPEYLQKFSIPVHDYSLLDSALMSGKKVFLFTRYPGEIDNTGFRRQHACTVNLISNGISYHNLFEVERRN